MHQKLFVILTVVVTLTATSVIAGRVRATTTTDRYQEAERLEEETIHQEVQRRLRLLQTTEKTDVNEDNLLDGILGAFENTVAETSTEPHDGRTIFVVPNKCGPGTRYEPNTDTCREED